MLKCNLSTLAVLFVGKKMNQHILNFLRCHGRLSTFRYVRPPLILLSRTRCYATISHKEKDYEEMEVAKTTPMMSQYFKLKEQHKGTFDFGSFYLTTNRLFVIISDGWFLWNVLWGCNQSVTSITHYCMLILIFSNLTQKACETRETSRTRTH